MLRKDIEEKFPFLSVVTYGGQEYIGIINNQDSFITSMYIFTDLLTEDEKAKFIELGSMVVGIKQDDSYKHISKG